MVATSAPLTEHLHQALQQLYQAPFPHVPSPEGSEKRASVALILRIRPSREHFSENEQDDGGGADSINRLNDFFSRPWVRHGDPEVLFIKRAGRRGDRWSGHTALPGGRRDPPDVDDRATAVRETMEEIGLDLTTPNCLYIGNLPERVVTTAWGREALMVLCPYIFLMTGKSLPPLNPQPTEVAAIHWVPLRAILAPSQRTRELVDVSSRFSQQGGLVLRKLLRFLLGQMMFSAVDLIPSESLFASSIPGFIPGATHERPFSGLARGAFGIPSSSAPTGQRLLLWGLTLGVLTDLLDMLPPHNAVKLWRYPTFTALDVRFIVYVMTRSLRKNNAGFLSTGSWSSQTAVDATTAAVAVSEAEPRQLSQDNDVGIAGLGVGTRPSEPVRKLLSGYYERMNAAIAVSLALRGLVGAAAIFWFVRTWRGRRR